MRAGAGATCDHHIQSAYAKARVSSRAAAAMFALEHGLVGTGAPAGPGSS